MATEDGCSSFGGDQKLSSGSSFFCSNGDSQFSNFNLNAINQKCSKTDSVDSKSISLDSKTTKNNNYHQNFDGNNKNRTNNWDKSNGIDSKKSDSLNIFHSKKNEQNQKQKDETSSNLKNDSTLSLHISAYENAIVAENGQNSVENHGDKDSKKNKIWKDVKAFESTSKNPFELSRQQENGSNTPETMQFKSSLKLPYPNLSPNKAFIEEKEKANKFYKAGRYAEAAKAYAKILLLPFLADGERAIVHCNRAAAYLNLLQFKNSLLLAKADAKKSIELKPKWWKAYYRLAEVLIETEEWNEAKICLQSALKCDPSNKNVTATLQVIEKELIDSNLNYQERRQMNQYRNQSFYDTDSSSEEETEIARRSPNSDRSPTPFSVGSVLDSSREVNTIFDSSAQDALSQDVIIDETNESQRGSSLAMRSNFGVSFKPPNKKGDELNEKEIECLLRNQKHRDFKWITKKAHINSFDTLCYQKKVNDIPQKTKYDMCQFCRKIYVNTGGLKRHRKICTKSTAPLFVAASNDPLVVKLPVTKDFEEAEKREIGKAFAKCSLDGLLPFSFIHHPSTVDLIVTLVNIGVQRQINAPSEPSLPGRFTVKNYSMTLSEERQKAFRACIGDILKFSTGAIAVDYGERLGDYLCAVLHFIKKKNDKLTMCEAIIGFESSNGKKSADKVWKNLVEAVEPIGITAEMLKKMTGVSDEGSNVVKCLNDNLKKSIRCSSHVFNTCPKRTIKLYQNPLRNSKYSFDYDEKINIQIGADLVSDVIQLINIVNRKKNLPDVLGKKLHTHCETRFLSKLMCLRDVEANLETLYNSQYTVPPFLDDDEKILFGKIYDRRRTLRVLIEIFSLYEYPVVSLQSSSKPTLNQVWPITLEIIQKLENLYETSDVIGKALAKASLAAIERKVLKGFISETHKIATVLNPSTRKLNGVSTIEKQSVYRKIREQLDEPSPQFSTRPLLSMEEEDDESDELSSYLSFKFGNTTANDFDLLDFWDKNKLQFPQLFKIAMNALCIPATSCSPERGFSVMKKLIPDERSQLAANTVSSIMIGRSLEDADSIEK